MYIIIDKNNINLCIIGVFSPKGVCRLCKNMSYSALKVNTYKFLLQHYWCKKYNQLVEEYQVYADCELLKYNLNTEPVNVNIEIENLKLIKVGIQC